MGWGAGFRGEIAKETLFSNKVFKIVVRMSVALLLYFSVVKSKQNVYKNNTKTKSKHQQKKGKSCCLIEYSHS